MSPRHAFMTIMPLSNWRQINKMSVSKLNRANRANSRRVSYLQLNTPPPKKDYKNYKHLEPVYRWKYQKIQPKQLLFIPWLSQHIIYGQAAASSLYPEKTSSSTMMQPNKTVFSKPTFFIFIKEKKLEILRLSAVEVNCILGISFSRELLNISSILWYRVLCCYHSNIAFKTLGSKLKSPY